MWGSWTTTILAGLGAALLLIAFAATAWTPLFAIAIASVVIAAIATVYAIRSGSTEAGTEAGSRKTGPKTGAAERARNTGAVTETPTVTGK